MTSQRGVRVRPARLEEAEAVAALFNAINSMDGPPPLVPMTAETVRRDLLGADPRAALLVAELDGALVGFVTGNAIYDSARSADAWLLNDLYVAPEARRRGAGRALVAQLRRRHGGGAPSACGGAWIWATTRPCCSTRPSAQRRTRPASSAASWSARPSRRWRRRAP